ncbi:MAG: hypothetical protein IJM85_04545 [Clostridia bacterium]|nr:hypothetical protein [Clostridia bacterium]
MLEGGKSASKTAEELGTDKNTVCRWAREYREALKIERWTKLSKPLQAAIKQYGVFLNVF